MEEIIFLGVILRLWPCIDVCRLIWASTCDWFKAGRYLHGMVVFAHVYEWQCPETGVPF